MCKSKNLKVSFDLGKTYLCDHYVKKKQKQPKFPLRLNLCKSCGFSQIDAVVDKNYIYKDYIYETKSSLTLKKHFKNYANKVCAKIRLSKSDLVLDIGSNDGTLLKFFKKRKCKVLGIEPASKIAKRATLKGIKTLPLFFDNSAIKKVIDLHQKPKIITLNNLFANVDDLKSLLKNMKKILSSDGTIVIESSYLGLILKNNIFDWIYHEHLSYFSIMPMLKFFKKYGFILYDLEKSNSKGGSYRYYFTLASNKNKISKIVTNAIKYEKVNSINSLKGFIKFKKRIDNEKIKIIDYLKNKNYKNIVGFGASATSTTLISYFGLNKYLNFLVDDNPDKIRTFSPGFHIPVHKTNFLKQKNNNIIILLAWRYKDIILKKLKIIKKKKRKKFIVLCPLPKFKIIYV